ncbi:MAG: DUF2970 domain-containing protein [Burkholderiaceae bacterium]
MNEPIEPGAGEKQSRNATFWQTARAVFWSFFGVRKRSDYERDAAHLNPVHVVIAGLIGALIFIFILILIVKSVVK